MAAYAALVCLVNDLELIPNHPTHSFSFENTQITSLSQIVHFLIDFTETYDPHGCTREAAQMMESRIAYAAHAAHDVIESHVVDQLHAGTTLVGKSTTFFLLDLEKAIHNLHCVKRKAMLFKEKSGMKAATYSTPASSETLTSMKNAMVGFDGVSLRLLEMLAGESSAQRVIPIVGMGGTGKTTLARHVFEHSFIQDHFDVRLWATISQKYSVENILKELLSENSTCTSNYCELGEKLHKKLWGRRFLIVLDDMWSVEAWDEIQRFLPDNKNGSCVVVTTRLSNLAAYLSSSPFEMELLDSDRSWELFCGKIFGEEDCSNELEEIGKKIVKRCRGLPLSIVVIAGHLRRSSRAIEYWEMVANLINPISSLGEDEQCLEILRLSYENLPACLKPCFLYLGIFQEDQWIDAPQVLRFWIAEGFVKGKTGVSLEEVAEDYLKDLIDRNLILVRQRTWNGNVDFFGIHDIVRELLFKVGEQEKFLGVLKVIGGGAGTGADRRILVPRELLLLSGQAVAALQLPSLLRSLMCQELCFMDELTVNSRLLRLFVNVSNASMDNKNDDGYFPNASFHHFNLRYLVFKVHSGDLPYPYPIPSAMRLIWNIQTLILDNYKSAVSVPYDIWELTQLRYVEFSAARFLVDPLHAVMNDQSGQEKRIVLENLHTLGIVSNLRLTEEVCKRMPNIKNLELSYCDLPGDCKAISSYYCPHNLGLLNKLESLKCKFGDVYKCRNVVQNFVLPTSLEELSLTYCHWEDLSIIIKSLPRLGSLHLLSIRGPKCDFAEEEFPRLKVLMISSCGDLIDWNANSSQFPVLEDLSIWGAPKLSEIPFDIGEIPTLKCIHLYECSVSAGVSAMRIVVEQESLGNDDLLLKLHFWEMDLVERFQKIVQEECLTTNSLRLSYPLSDVQTF